MLRLLFNIIIQLNLNYLRIRLDQIIFLAHNISAKVLCSIPTLCILSGNLFLSPIGEFCASWSNQTVYIICNKATVSKEILDAYLSL